MVREGVLQRAFGIVVLAVIGSSAVRAEPTGSPAGYRVILKREADKANLPFAVADAVMAIESGYDPTRIGGVGEIGLMQVRPGTAAMLGFTGDAAALAEPETNIRYGVTYLAKAWRLADGDLCRALMKYRAGHGEEVMTQKSADYCGRARAHLAALGSPLARGPDPVVDPAGPGARLAASHARPAVRLTGAAFWAAHDARIRILTARVERRWRRIASR